MTSLKGVLDYVYSAGGNSTKLAEKFFGWGNGTTITKTIADFTKKQLIENGWTKETLGALVKAFDDKVITKVVSGAINKAAVARKDWAVQILQTFFK